MSDKHSSDSIKKALNEAAGINGNDKDWKRRSKTRNADGEWERVFEHAQNGTVVVATEGKDGAITTRILDESGKADLTRAKAAKYCFAIGDSDDVDADEEIIIYITPVAYFEKTGYCYDQPSHLEDLLPEGADDINECGNYVIPRSGKSDTEMARELITRGFVWRADFQDLMFAGLDAKTRQETAKAQAAVATKASATKLPKP